MTSDSGKSRGFNLVTIPYSLSRVLAFKNTFLTKLTSINIRSREFPHALTEVLASQESTNNVTALQGEDALTLVDILDQVSIPRIT